MPTIAGTHYSDRDFKIGAYIGLLLSAKDNVALITNWKQASTQNDLDFVAKSNYAKGAKNATMLKCFHTQQWEDDVYANEIRLWLTKTAQPHDYRILDANDRFSEAALQLANNIINNAAHYTPANIQPILSTPAFRNTLPGGAATALDTMCAKAATATATATVAAAAILAAKNVAAAHAAAAQPANPGDAVVIYSSKNEVVPSSKNEAVDDEMDKELQKVLLESKNQALLQYSSSSSSSSSSSGPTHEEKLAAKVKKNNR